MEGSNIFRGCLAIEPGTATLCGIMNSALIKRTDDSTPLPSMFHNLQ
jgi:hypothetical protein